VEYFISSEFFVGQAAWLLLAVTATSIAVLAWGADRLVDGASGLAAGFGVPKVVVAATVVSLGTTSPECAVSVIAAWSGEPGLALGNAIGSVVTDTGLIFGLGCLLATLPADRKLLNRQGWFQAGSAVVLALLCYGSLIASGPAAVLGRGAGLLLTALLVAYLYLSVRWSRRDRGFVDVAGDLSTGQSILGDSTAPVGKLLAMLALGLFVVVCCSQVLVLAVSELAVQAGISKLVIAGTLVALGTSLPELVVGLSAVRKGHPEILVGTVIGADVLNVLFVVGASALAAPLPLLETGAELPALLFYLHLPVMLLMLGWFRFCVGRAGQSGRFSRWMGGPLLAAWVFYVAVQAWLGAAV
jgi:cation:H+ antiporter